MVALDSSAVVIPLTHDNRFEEFWQLYPAPRRSGKALCKAKWDAIVGPTGLRTRTRDRDAEVFVLLTLSATPEEIIAGLKRCREQWKTENYKWKDDGKFIPMPSTWLNQGRWMD